MAKREISVGLGKYEIGYEIIGQGKDIIFLHGWGANKELMKKAFSQYFNGFRQIYIDLPGFGASNIIKPLKTADYAEIISKFLSEIKVENFCIIAHSFGGKVATLLEPKILVLLSSAGIMNKKPFLTRIKIKIFKILKFFGLGKFYKIFASVDAKDMSRNMYETFKNVVNEDFSKNYKACTSQAMVFWGQDDITTPLSDGEKISRLLPNCTHFEFFSGDHFFFIAQAQKISTKICEKLSKNLG